MRFCTLASNQGTTCTVNGRACKGVIEQRYLVQVQVRCSLKMVTGWCRRHLACMPSLGTLQFGHVVAIYVVGKNIFGVLCAVLFIQDVIKLERRIKDLLGSYLDLLVL